MWPIVGILLVAILIILYEVPRMRKNKMNKELWVFSILLGIGISLNIAHSLDVKLPNPLDLITVIYKPVSDMIFGWLK